MPKGQQRHTNTVAQTLVACNVCGGKHLSGSGRARTCQGRNSRPTSLAVAPRSSSTGGSPLVLSGEWSCTGEGDHPADLPKPHAVFSAQILPKDIPAVAQPDDDLIPSSKGGSKSILLARAAARSAVREWRRKGVEPTQEMMLTMDVYDEETHELFESHMAATAADLERLSGQGLSTSALSNADQAHKQCFRAVLTAKGLALSPTNVQRLIARAAPGVKYSARDFTAFAVGLRALAAENPTVRELLSKSADEIEAADIRPVVSLLRNVGGLSAGRVRLERENALSEVSRSNLAGFGPDTVLETSQALAEICRESTAQGRDVSLSVYDDHADLLALPTEVAGSLVASEISYGEWRSNGWDFPPHETLPKYVLLEPALVKMRMDGHTDEIIRSVRPEITDQSADYAYAPVRFFTSSGAYALGGMSSHGARQFGAEPYKEQVALVQRLYRDRNFAEPFTRASGF